MEKYSEQPLRPASEGGHVLGAWRGGFAFRQPPYNLADIHGRFIEHVLAANPGAGMAYPMPDLPPLPVLMTPPAPEFATDDDDGTTGTDREQDQ